MWNDRSAKRRFSLPARLLLLVGVALQLAAGLNLLRGADLLQYSICPPDVQRLQLADGSIQTETGLSDLAEARLKLEEDLGGVLRAAAVSGMKSGQNIDANAKSAEAALVATGPRWLEANPHPLASGRWMDGHELENGARVAVLDEDLAFALFGSEDALGQVLGMDGAEYKVIGTLRHSRGVGEENRFSIYIPLATADKQGLQLETLTMHALPAAASGVRQSFEAAMQAQWGSGTLHDLSKEAMGAMLLSRMIIFALGMALLFRIGGLWKRLCARFAGQISALRAKAYAAKWLPRAIWRIGFLILLGAGLLLAAYALLAFLIEPVYTFTEWVPESLVSLKALQTVFWSRTTAAARAVRIVTPESARIAFWALLARWGAVAFLLGLALGRKNLKKMPKTGNQSGPEGV